MNHELAQIGATLSVGGRAVADRAGAARRWSLRHLPFAVVAALGVTAALGVWYVLAPPMGTDLSAQVAHADFVRGFGLRPVDLGWYGGFNAFSYSWTTPPLIALLGVRWLGVGSAVVFAGAMAYVLVRTGARRAALGGVLFGLVAIVNLISGRITFLAGLATAAGALAIAVRPAAGRPVLRRLVVALLSVLTAVTSPVSGTFLGLAALAWLLGDLRWDRSAFGWVRLGPRATDAFVLGAGAAIGLIPLALFSSGGVQPYSFGSMRDFVALTVFVLLVVPASDRVVRVGAVLTIGLLVIAYVVPTPIGSNVLRLPLLFAIPVVASCVPWRSWALAAALAGMFWWRPPLVSSDVVHAGAAETRASFYQPLLTDLARLGPIGRVEVVPLRDHWESVYVAQAVPLARGWLRQTDVARNLLFYQSTPMTPDQYGAWLRTNAVEYVAVASSPLDSAGRREAAVVHSDPSYLREVWRGGAWTLYRVVQPQPFIQGANLIASEGGAVTFDAPGRGVVTIRVHWSPWLTSTGGTCVEPAQDGWCEIQVPAAGRYVVASSLAGGCT